MISRPALKYNGGKFRLREWILSYFPNHSAYVETCFGAGSVLFSKARSKVEIANDIDKNIENFFTVLRDKPKDLIRRITFTPYSQSSMDLAFDNISNDDPIVRAWAFYIICWTSLRANNISKSNADFRLKGNIDGKGGHNPARLLSQTKHLYQIAQRLRGVTITNLDATKIIKTYDSLNTLFYVDLPYLGESRNTKKLYNHELLSNDSHAIILESLTKISGMAIVSHYPHPLYDSILNNFMVVKKETLSNSMVKGADRKSKLRTECLYLSPSVINKIKLKEAS
jgi:DNA adenine methylase